MNTLGDRVQRLVQGEDAEALASAHARASSARVALDARGWTERIGIALGKRLFGIKDPVLDRLTSAQAVVRNAQEQVSLDLDAALDRLEQVARAVGDDRGLADAERQVLNDRLDGQRRRLLTLAITSRLPELADLDPAAGAQMSADEIDRERRDVDDLRGQLRELGNNPNHVLRGRLEQTLAQHQTRLSNARLAHVVSELDRLEREQSGDPGYRALRGRLLDQLSSHGNTRDWAAAIGVSGAGSIAATRFKAIDSLGSLAGGLVDGSLVDFQLAGDRAFDDLALRLKLGASDRAAPGDESQGDAAHRRLLVNAQHDLRNAQRDLATNLRVKVSDRALLKQLPGAAGEVPFDEVLWGPDSTSAMPQKDEVFRVFSGAGTGDVRMDARLFAALRAAQGSDGTALDRDCDLLMARVRHLQDEVDRLSRGPDQDNPLPRALSPRTQAERRLALELADGVERLNREDRQIHDRVEGLIDTRNGDLRDRINAQRQVVRGMEQNLPRRNLTVGNAQNENELKIAYRMDSARSTLRLLETHDAHLQGQIDQSEARLQQIRQERNGLQSRLRADDFNLRTRPALKNAQANDRLANNAPANDRLANLELQILDERERLDAARQEFGDLADHGVDKEQAQALFAEKGALPGGRLRDGEVAQIRSALSPAGDGRLSDAQRDQVLASLDNLAGRGFASSKDVLAGAGTLAAVTKAVFNRSSTLASEEMEAQRDFSPEIRSQSYCQSVLQTLVEDNGNLALKTDDPAVALAANRRFAHLRVDAPDRPGIPVRGDGESPRDLAMDLAGSIAENEADITAAVSRYARLGAQAAAHDRAAARDHYTRPTAAASSRQRALQARSAMKEVERTINDLQGTRRQQLRQYTETLDQLFADKTWAADPAGDVDPSPGSASHRLLTAAIRAAVLAERPRGMPLHLYDPTSRMDAIEQRLVAWGLDLALVRPLVTDVISSSLDRAEMHRWEGEFADLDTSLGSGRGPDAQGKDAHRLRIDRQVRHLAAVSEELTPGSKARVNFGRGWQFTGKAGFDIVKFGAEAEVSGGRSSHDELTIGRQPGGYDLYLKAGNKSNLSAALQVTFVKLLKANLEGKYKGYRISGLQLQFDNTDQNGSPGLARMQKVLARMAEGDGLSIDEWNGLADKVKLVLEHGNEEELEASVTLGKHWDTPGAWTRDKATVSAAAKLGFALGGRREYKEWITVDDKTRSERSELEYAMSADISGSLGVTAAPGKEAMEAYEKDTSGHFGGDGALSGDAAAGSGLGVTESGTLRGAIVGGGVEGERALAFGSTVVRDRVDDSYGADCEYEIKAPFPADLGREPAKKIAAAENYLNHLADVTGNGSDFRAAFQQAQIRAQIGQQALQASGSDMVKLTMSIRPDALARANARLAEARQLEDTTKGSVTQDRRNHAQRLRDEADAIVRDKKNYQPHSLVILPTQTSQVSHSRPWIPGDNTASKVASIGIAMIQPSVEFDAVGIDVGAKLATTKTASSKLELGTTIHLQPGHH